MQQRLLVADDSEAMQKAIKLAFQPYAVQIFTALSLSAACEVSRACRPQAIIADASLCGVSSPADFLQLLSLAEGNPPLLLLEGSFERVSHEAYAAAGLQHFLQKPFALASLLTWAENHCHFERLTASISSPSPSPSSAFFSPPAPTPTLTTSAQQQLSQEVQAYCRSHFNELAREVIQEELQKLAADRVSKA